MAITVNTNMASLIAQQSLNSSTNKMNVAMERLSTGLKINSATDDAAGSSVVTKMNYKVQSLAVAQDNAQIGVSMLQTTEGALDVVQSNLERIRELTEQAANGTYGSDSLEAMKAEINARLNEISRVSASTEFNGKKVLDGSCDNINLQVGIECEDSSIIELVAEMFDSVAASDLLLDEHVYNLEYEGKVLKYQGPTPDGGDAPDPVLYAKIGGDYVQVVEDDGEYFVVFEDPDKSKDYSTAKFAPADVETKLRDLDPDTVTKVKDSAPILIEDGITVPSGSGEATALEQMLSWVYTNDTTARAFLKNIDNTLMNITNRKTELGAVVQRINSAMDVAETMETNLTEALSLIQDADIAEESSNYIKNQILQQTTASLLATANQTPQIALQLL